MSTPLSIGLISDDFLPAMTGVGVHLQDLARELVSRGHHVFLLTSRRHNELEQEEWNEVHIYRLRTLKLYGFYQTLPTKQEINQIFIKERPNLIHHHYLGYMMMQACHVAQTLSIPQILTYHFGPSVLTRPLLMRPFRRLIEKQVVAYSNRLSAIIVPSLPLITELRKNIHVPIHHITNWISFDEKEYSSLKKDTRPFTILFVGRLAYEKNISLLLRSLKDVLQTLPDARLLIIGDGPDKTILIKESVALHIDKNVTFLGHIEHDRLPSYYSTCDVFVLPSKEETFSLVAIEALWFSKPIIVTRTIASARELVTEGINGYVVDADRDQELTQRLITLAHDESLRNKMGLASREKAQAYSKNILIDSIESLYTRLVKNISH